MNRMCTRCGEMAVEEPRRSYGLIVCPHCGFTEENLQSGWDDEDRLVATSNGDGDDDEDDEDEGFAPEEWWEFDEDE